MDGWMDDMTDDVIFCLKTQSLLFFLYLFFLFSLSHHILSLDCVLSNVVTIIFGGFCFFWNWFVSLC